MAAMHPSILVGENNYFNFLAPDESIISIGMIARALSRICRFGGHTKQFYSVAQHCVLASHLVEPQHALAALLHDAAEAFVGDMPSPLKRLCPEYRAIEKRVHQSIFTKFGLPAELHPQIKWADLVLLKTEQRDLMPPHDDAWPITLGVPAMRKRIAPWENYRVAEKAFMYRFDELCNMAWQKMHEGG